MTVTVSVLVSGLDAELRRLGYKPSTMVWYHGCWLPQRWFAFHGVQEFRWMWRWPGWMRRAAGFLRRSRPAR